MKNTYPGMEISKLSYLKQRMKLNEREKTWKHKMAITQTVSIGILISVRIWCQLGRTSITNG